LTLRMPSLLEIASDVPLLANHFLKNVCIELGVIEKSFSKDALQALSSHSWPGNIRELQNVIRRAVLFSKEETIGARQLMIESPLVDTGAGVTHAEDAIITPYKEAKDICLDSFTRQYIHTLLTRSHGNVSQAARMSALTRAALQKIMRRYDIDGNRFR